MRTRSPILIVCLVVLPLAIVFNFPPTAAGADEKAVRDADEAWAKSAATKDVDKTVAFYADDAIALPPNETAAKTKDEIRNLWKRMLDTVTDISWTATRVEMAKSGEMACVTGTYQLTMKDGTKDHGKYCEVWEKKGGAWKCGTDIWNSDIPVTKAAP